MPSTGTPRVSTDTPGSRRPPTDHGVRRQCASEFKFAKAETLSFLIRSEWIRQEADKRGISLTDRELDRAFSDRKRQFRSAKDFRRYLADSGMTASQFDARVRRDALAHKLMLAVASPDLSVSRADVARFYRNHASEFDQPRTRDLRAVITRSRASARRARRALESGRPWGAVVREFSTDVSRSTGGHIPIDTRNVLRGLRTAVFSADLDTLVGPLSVKGVWWVFTVRRDRPTRRLTLSESTPRIRTIIASTREQLGLDRLTAYLTRHYRPHTTCEPGFHAPECGGAALPDP
jgi:foldase protein PrsA